MQTRLHGDRATVCWPNMHKPNKKLALDRQVVRILSADQVQQVKGGAANAVLYNADGKPVSRYHLE